MSLYLSNTAFRNKLNDIAKDWGLLPTDIIALYNHEGLGNYRQEPPVGTEFYGKYYGLFGFYIPYANAVANQHNLTNWKNDPVQQLKLHYYMQNPFAHYWKEELDPVRKRDIYYLSNFLPAAVVWAKNGWLDKPLEFTGLSARTLASANPGFDLNKDGVLTLREVFAYYHRVFDGNRKNSNDIDVRDSSITPDQKKKSSFLIFFVFAFLPILLFLYGKK